MEVEEVDWNRHEFLETSGIPFLTGRDMCTDVYVQDFHPSVTNIIHAQHKNCYEMFLYFQHVRHTFYILHVHVKLRFVMCVS